MILIILTLRSFGGLSVTLSGGALGTATFGAGYEATAQIGIKVSIFIF